MGSGAVHLSEREAARLLTAVENGRRVRLPNPQHRAFRVGVTGPTGVGKSTLIDRLTSGFRLRRKKVGILTVDPTSPLSGGALLGDRVRMRGHFTDRGVFIRSLATRGAPGGISAAIAGAARVLDLLKTDVIFIETVGAGQDQVAIRRVADLVLVLVVPQMGDEIQALKAGLLEIGDLTLVNKADLFARLSARLETRALSDAVERAARQLSHLPQVLKISAARGDGIADLGEKIWEEMKRSRGHT